MCWKCVYGYGTNEEEKQDHYDCLLGVFECQL